jgi:hypothetical protein
MRNSSPVYSAIVEPLSSDKFLQPDRLSRNTSAYATETRLFNPLPEAANFDGFSDMNELDDIPEATIIKPGSTSKARSIAISGWSSEAEIAPRQRRESNNRRQRSLSLDLAGPQTATSQPVPSQCHGLSSYNSLDSLSSLDSFNIPIAKRAYPLQPNNSVVSRSANASGMPSHLATSNEEQGDSYSHSLFELGSSSRDNYETRHLDYVRRDPVLRRSVDSDRNHDADVDSLLGAVAEFPPDIAMYRVQNAVGSPLAQVEMMLQKRGDENNSNTKNANKDTGLIKEDKIEQAEKRLRELKNKTASGSRPVNSYKHASAKLKKKEAGGFFQRLRGQK